MLLFEAENLIKSRIMPTNYETYGANIIQQCDADIVAIRCIKAQMRLADILNDWWSDIHEEDTLSAQLVYDILTECRFDWRGDNDGTNEDKD